MPCLIIIFTDIRTNIYFYKECVHLELQLQQLPIAFKLQSFTVNILTGCKNQFHAFSVQITLVFRLNIRIDINEREDESLREQDSCFHTFLPRCHVLAEG